MSRSAHAASAVWGNAVEERAQPLMMDGMGRIRAAGAPTGPALIVAGAVTLGYFLFVAMFTARVLGPSDGTVVMMSDQVVGARLVVSDVVDPVSELRVGDAVVAIAGMPVDRARLAPLTADETVTYTVDRDGQLVDVDVRLLPRWPGLEWLQRNWAALLLSASMLAMAVTAFRRRPDDPGARTLLAIASINSVGMLAFVLGAQVVDLVQSTGLWWYAAGEITLTLSWVLWLLFVLVFPEPVGGHPVRTLVARCLVLLIATIIPSIAGGSATVGYTAVLRHA